LGFLSFVGVVVIVAVVVVFVVSGTARSSARSDKWCRATALPAPK